MKPLVVFAGRSNVGKSSVIRHLTGRDVTVGKKPGSTRKEIKIDMGSVLMVDIPGFGFMAGRSKKRIEQTKTSIIRKLEEWGEDILLAVLIIDISLFRELYERWSSRGEIPIDVEFYTFLSEIASNVIVVANKMDKLKKRERGAELDYLRRRLLEYMPSREPIIVPISAKEGKNIGRLRHTVEQIIVQSGVRSPDWP
ncbi:MAG: GTP-binding protein EngB [Candidatus Lokiarchaeota archaeon]|jgi:GTP-binding protein EngB required for normal cell division|nr:GTP-binding protein EngB [Candidatus Lokiarchaeota archaeon]